MLKVVIGLSKIGLRRCMRNQSRFGTWGYGALVGGDEGVYKYVEIAVSSL